VRRTFLAVPMIIATGLIAAACGSSSSSSSPTSAPGAATSGQAAANTSSASNSPYSYGGGSTASSSTSTATGTKVTTKHAKKLGTILAAGTKELTVYMFAADKGSASSCTGACAAAWPPVIAKGSPTASGQATSADLGTITRAGGVKQVTYHGHPLYYFIKDKDDGDAYGQGAHAFGADWYVLAPSGTKVDNS
jgi:predicted lipoprotein with Yx(FWY)xxD motif